MFSSMHSMNVLHKWRCCVLIRKIINKDAPWEALWEAANFVCRHRYLEVAYRKKKSGLSSIHTIYSTWAAHHRQWLSTLSNPIARLIASYKVEQVILKDGSRFLELISKQLCSVVTATLQNVAAIERVEKSSTVSHLMSLIPDKNDLNQCAA